MVTRSIVSALAATAFTSLASASPTTPETVAISECLKRNIQVTAVDFNASVIDGRRIQVNLTNATTTPLGGVWVSYEIWAEERPLPLHSGSIRPAATISGALLPGESATFSDSHFMEERERQFARETSNLTIRFTIDNAADSNMDGFFDHPRMGSWSGYKTEQVCGPSES
jgi:hypothetical protein